MQGKKGSADIILGLETRWMAGAQGLPLRAPSSIQRILNGLTTRAGRKGTVTVERLRRRRVGFAGEGHEGLAGAVAVAVAAGAGVEVGVVIEAGAGVGVLIVGGQGTDLAVLGHLHWIQD